jgi:hypothetical protein
MPRILPKLIRSIRERFTRWTDVPAGLHMEPEEWDYTEQVPFRTIAQWVLPADARHIAAFSPSVALSLLAQLRATDERLTEVLAERDTAEARGFTAGRLVTPTVNAALLSCAKCGCVTVAGVECACPVLAQLRAAGEENERLRAVVIGVAGFLHGVSQRTELGGKARVDLRDEADHLRQLAAGGTVK